MNQHAIKARFPKWTEWVGGKIKPTLKQLEHFAKQTSTPIGYLFLSEPPVERMPILDLRTLDNAGVDQPSPNLLDTLYICQQRQDWYRDFSNTNSATKCNFVGTVRLGDSIVKTAEIIRRALHFDLDERSQIPTWTDALRRFIDQADALGVLVMVNGVVNNNNQRKLDPKEFRGFALADDLAPLVFVNGADAKSAQMFALAHELVYLWLGKTALSNSDLSGISSHQVEQWCNRVAAEILVPNAALQSQLNLNAALGDETERLARYFKVSRLVILKRLHDSGRLTRVGFQEAYNKELVRLESFPKSSGGNFYLTRTLRVGKRFAKALVASTLEGQTLYKDAFHLLGFSKIQTFLQLSRNLRT